MTRWRSPVFVMAGIAAMQLAAVEVPELNLLTDSKFTPVEMHGRTTAAFGWAMSDNPRRNAGGLHGKYLSGEGLFDLEVKDGVMRVSYPEELHPVYRKGGTVDFDNTLPLFGFEAGMYRVRAKVRVPGGRFAFSDGTVVKPAPDWQSVDFTSSRRVAGFSYRPVPGGGFSITDFTVCPEYPRIGGEINLPDGGKLTRLLLPEGASQMTRWCVAVWQYWLWRFTGVALPVEVVSEVSPAKGALAVMLGEAAPGGWQLKVDRNGITLVCSEEAAFGPAVFDYLRDLGYTRYSNRAPGAEITPDPAFILKAADKKIAPRYRYFVYGIDAVGNNDRRMLYTRNSVDYFHLPKGTMDHVLNIVMPSEMYYKDHPEYFAMDKSGNRVVENYIYRTSPCFANQQAFNICADNLVKYALGQPERPQLLFYIGDGANSCRCDECAEVNRGIKGNYSQMMMKFYNRVARELRTRAPRMRVAFGAYADAQEPPVEIKPEPNIYCTYAVTHKRGFPCTLHHDCELNKFGWQEVEAWSKYIGRENLGPMTYRDMRPLFAVEQMKRFNKYMSNEIFSWVWMGWSPSIPFVLSRWNYGDDDVVALMEEFNDHYYGKAGKYVTEINLLLEEFARNYRHTPEEIAAHHDKKRVATHVGLRCGDISSRTVIDRALFDKIYALLDQGLAEIGDADSYARQNTLHEKAYYLFEDLNRYRLADCRDDQELARYADRAATLVRIAREVPTVRRKLIPMHSTQDLFTLFTGIVIEPSKKAWCDSPEVEEFLKDPAGALALEPERVPGGLRFAPRLMKGGIGTSKYSYKCPPRIANFVRRASSGQHEIVINFNLDKDIAENTMLSLTGLDDDSKGVGCFAVEINGRRIFDGPNVFPEHNWGHMGIPVPAGVFKAGINVIKFINTTPEEAGAYNVTEDYTWGWVGFSDAVLLNPNGDFKAFLKGGRNRTGWYQARQKFHQPLGNVAVKDGKLVVKGKGAGSTGAAFFRIHRYPKIASHPCRSVAVEVSAAGEGELVVSLWPYGVKGFLGVKALDKMSRRFKLSGEKRTFRCTIPLHPNVRLIVPEVGVADHGRAEIDAFNLELVPGRKKVVKNERE